jgi:hypothetical protein
MTARDPRFAQAKAEHDAHGRKYPSRPDLRCDALSPGTSAMPSGPEWSQGVHRCGNPGSGFRDGRWACAAHRVTVSVEYTCGNHFDAFASTMSIALGQAS